MAVKEFKFTGLGPTGQPVQGTVFAPSKRAANQKVNALADKHGFRTRAVQQRQVFSYKVRHPNGKVVQGEQKAFSSEEISTALSKMGLEVIKVQKKLFTYQRKPPRQDMIMFVRAPQHHEGVGHRNNRCRVPGSEQVCQSLPAPCAEAEVMAHGARWDIPPPIPTHSYYAP